MLRLLSFILVILSQTPIFAAPIPGTGSSYLPHLLKNVVISDFGFKVGTTHQNFWRLRQNTDTKAIDTYQYLGNSAQSRASFTINVDKFSQPTSFSSYIKKSVKEYPYFGFEILKTQVMKIGGEPCYLVDLAHRKKNKQMRQFVVVRKEFAVVMTCVDEIGKFKETSQECADLINNFQWTGSGSRL